MRSERGSATAEMVILWPLLILVVYLGTQAAIWYYARCVAIAGAQEGAQAAGGSNGTPGDGATSALDYLRDAGDSSYLKHVQASEQRTPVTVTVTVTGASLRIVPGWPTAVRQSATASIERITAP